MNGFNECDFLCQAGKYEEAIKVYDEVLKIDPLNANMWNKKGTALNELKRFEEAIKAYDEALKIYPQFVEAWINKGHVYIKLKRYKLEKGNYYEGYEALRGDEFSRKFLNLKMPEGYYECDIHEPVEECDYDSHKPIDSVELEDFDETDYFDNIESVLGNYGLMQYYCKEKDCAFLNPKIPKGYYECDILESVEDYDGLSETEAKTILESEIDIIYEHPCSETCEAKVICNPDKQGYGRCGKDLGVTESGEFTEQRWQPKCILKSP